MKDNNARKSFNENMTETWHQSSKVSASMPVFAHNTRTTRPARDFHPTPPPPPPPLPAHEATQNWSPPCRRKPRSFVEAHAKKQALLWSSPTNSRGRICFFFWNPTSERRAERRADGGTVQWSHHSTTIMTTCRGVGTMCFHLDQYAVISHQRMRLGT